MDLVDIAPLAEGLFMASTGADWAQTRQIARDPDRHAEANPILGNHPAQDSVNAYMPAAGAMQYGVYNALADEYKLPFALLTAIPEAVVVRHNQRHGLDVNYNALAAGALLSYLLHNFNDEKKSIDVGKLPGSNAFAVKFNVKF